MENDYLLAINIHADHFRVKGELSPVLFHNAVDLRKNFFSRSCEGGLGDSVDGAINTDLVAPQRDVRNIGPRLLVQRLHVWVQSEKVLDLSRDLEQPIDVVGLAQAKGHVENSGASRAVIDDV